MKLSFGLLALAAMAIAMPAASEPPRSPPDAHSCQTEDLRHGRPIVTSAETAKSIFLAVEGDLFPAANKIEYPEVVAEDEGAHWSVFRHRPAQPMPDGSLLVTRGGGQLSLSINKCDAKISQVWLSR
jgi:hypothetical protein